MLNSMNIIVEKKDITTVQTISSIEIMDGKINLDSSASFMVKLLGDSDSLIDIRNISLTGEAYSNWGNNDEYVVNYILNELGLVKA